MMQFQQSTVRNDVDTLKDQINKKDRSFFSIYFFLPHLNELMSLSQTDFILMKIFVFLILNCA